VLQVLFTSNLFNKKQKNFKFHCHINSSSSHNPGVLNNRKVTKTFFSPVDLNLFYNLLPGEIVFDSKFLTELAFIMSTIIETKSGLAALFLNDDVRLPPAAVGEILQNQIIA
jgi:hypothetical protein